MNVETKERCCSSTVCAYGVAVVGAFLIVMGLVWAMWHFTQPPPLGEDRAAVRRKALAELRADNVEKLNTYGWQDQSKGIVRLPITAAMKMVEVQWQNPAAARSNLNARVDKAFYVPPKPPEKPSQFE